MVDISKSSRHAKIAGDFGEALVLYWLSKFGFECASVDHTGIDLIARNPHNLHERLKTNRYVAPPVERVWIEKEGGKLRPIGKPCYEDKIVQRAVVMILAVIFEPIFLPFSCLTKPGTLEGLNILFGTKHFDLGNPKHERVFWQVFGSLLVDVDVFLGNQLAQRLSEFSVRDENIS